LILLVFFLWKQFVVVPVTWFILLSSDLFTTTFKITRRIKSQAQQQTASRER
jgi:hypothetical protein